MSAISKALALSKDEFQEFDDDGKIKEFLIELGISSQFNRSIPKGEAITQAVNHFHHPTHFILAVLYQGHDDAAQNGYMLWGIPKSKASTESFMVFSKRALSPSDEKIIETGIFWSGPGNTSN